MAAGALGGMAVSAVLVGGGFALGQVVDDNDPPAAADSASPIGTARPAIAEPGADASSSGSISVQPGPLSGVDADEPVSAVADAVASSVVLINTSIGQGSGIVWDAENGYIVTNNHVVGDASTVAVLLHNGIQTTGTVVGGDSARDVAVIQVDPDGLGLNAAVFAPSETVEVGQLAVAIGSPFGLDQSVTAGIVSAVNRINTFGGSDPANPVPVSMLQTDAPINPGNSGGALADRQGRVIGMNTSIRTDGVSSDNAGVGFAVPSDTIVLIAQRIVNGESLELGFLGIGGDTLTDGTLGAIVTEVVDSSPASVGGIEVGDLIISVNNSLISTMDELAADFKFFRPGEMVEIEVLRDGERLVMMVEVGIQPG